MSFNKADWQRERRKQNGYKDQNKYRKTLKGYMVYAYNGMLQRTKPSSSDAAYRGLPLLSNQEFREFTLNNQDYHRLFNNWVESGYNHKLSPSIDRIESTKGYTLDNIRWVTHSVNSSLGSKNLQKKKFNDLTGLVFGALTVTGLCEQLTSRGERQWVCLCRCGTETVVISAHLLSGNNVSCGCRRRNVLADAKRKKQRKVICLNNNKVYENAKMAAADCPLSLSSVQRILTGKQKAVAGYCFKYYDSKEFEEGRNVENTV
jgi:hypothetical protein